VRYTTRWPDSPRMWGELADAYEWLEDYPSVLPIAQRLLRITPKEDANRARLARAYYALGDYSQAAAHFDDLLRRHPGSAQYHQSMWLALEQLPADARNFTYARRLYRLTGPEHPEIGLLLARLHESREQPHAAELIYAALSRAHPDSVPLHAGIGNQLLHTRRLELARAYFLRALDIAPTSDEALSGLAAVAYEQNAPDALEHLKNLERRRPDDPETIYRLGLIYESLGDSTSMVAYYRRLLSLAADQERDDLYFFRRQAHALFRSGTPQRARELLQQARSQYPGSLALTNDYAEILIAEQEYDRALEVLDEVPDL